MSSPAPPPEQSGPSQQSGPSGVSGISGVSGPSQPSQQSRSPRRSRRSRPADRRGAHREPGRPAAPGQAAELGRRIAELGRRIAELGPRESARLSRRLQQAGADPARLVALETDLHQAEQRLHTRRAAVPAISYPPELPVSQRRDDLLAAIAEHQVVVVAGETGSGKTTQLPKLCLELGRGVRGMIGHTQPRRIAARAVAERLAEELGTEVGQAVGFAVRFTDRVSDTSLVKLMTDGILLAEIQRDRLLRGYDTIILDEAHERSLNIDFLLGYLKQLLPRRPDLKLIITSATIDPQRFAEYFDGAPVLEVSGRSYPVEVRYRPVVDPDEPEDAEDRDQITAICDALTELSREPAGDVLVFLSGEREIRDTADAVTALKLPDTEVLPLYARLSAAEQHRVFTNHRGRRVVLATNVAETSLTVPGIRYVVDAGTARISRYSQRTKVQLLPIEPISRASATQRAGRCGRTSEGICIRLYSQEDYESRPQFTDPEILRTNLASVILQMAALDLGPVAEFGFLDPPDARQVADGLALLTELGALATGAAGRAPAQHSLTELGRRIAQLPVDPRLARMILEADRRGCVRDVLVLAAALSIQDPRERPAEHQQAADAQHARFADPTSDFAGYLNLWRHVREQQEQLSSSQFRRMCRTEYLSYLRIREWQDLYGQLRQIVKTMGVRIGDQPADPEQVHRSLLSGLLSHIGLKDTARRDYLGARNARFAIFPGSALFRKQPTYLMAAELVETSRLWARVNAGIQPEWAEELAPHLVRRTYSEPHWERNRAAVVAYERVTLYGVPLVLARKVDYAGIDPRLSRELFIRHALVEGDWQTRHHFFAANRALVAEVQDLENRARRRDLLVDDESVFAFYDQRIPDAVTSGRHFDAWWKKTRRQRPDLLDLSTSQLVRPGAEAISAEQFPDRWTAGDFQLELSYHFEPGSAADGVTVDIPLPVLNEATAAGLDWQVPGLRTELVTALLRTLPKQLRRSVVPVPDTAAALVAALADDLGNSTGRLPRVLSAELRSLRGIDIPEDAWDLDRLPGHLRPTYRVLDSHGAVLGSGKDLAELQAKFAPAVTATLQSVTADLARDRLADWDMDSLPRTVRREVAGYPVTGYPSLVAENGAVAIRVLDSAAKQRRQMAIGTRQLLVNTIPSPVKQLIRGLSLPQRLTLSRAPHGSPAALLADCVAAAVDQLMAAAGGPRWDRAGFTELRARVAAELPATAAAIVATVERVMVAAQEVELALEAATAPPLAPVVADVRTQLAGLVYPGFVTDTGAEQLPQLPRYLRAMAHRLADAPGNLARDRDRQAQVEVVLADLAELRAKLGEGSPAGAGLAELRWMIEELRVSLFAQRLGTAHPVSVPRIQKAMDALEESVESAGSAGVL
ncbi:ATP-dependent RNA helicase HrpA [Jatrophihabitans sp.]|uniref:ATP-dependent RNA helicase HrpA n=1 Tax=Jatrophihabitans sp. TaxID=1932789 RepID=UPI002C4B9EA4|nr:ATP-dependent RNA helicase HrpA [Jatrophihabitans sp.]